MAFGLRSLARTLLVSLLVVPLAGSAAADPATAAPAMESASPTTANAAELFQMARRYWFGEDGLAQDRGKAIELFKKSARADYAPALYYLSDIYLKGTEATAADRGTAIALLKRAAQLGLVDAERRLAELGYRSAR